MANSNAAGLRFMRLRDIYGNMSHALSVRTCATQRFRVYTRIAPNTGMAQGRIVSISRGSPPPKKR